GYAAGGQPRPRPWSRRWRPTTLAESWASRKRRMERPSVLDPQDLDEGVRRLEFPGRAPGEDEGIIDLIGKFAIVGQRQVQLPGAETELVPTPDDAGQVRGSRFPGSGESAPPREDSRRTRRPPPPEDQGEHVQPRDDRQERPIAG